MVRNLILVGFLCSVLVLAACGAEADDAEPTPTATSTEMPGPPRNENVDALNAAQAAFEEQDYGFAPLLQDDKARVVLEVKNGVETARLSYPQQPANPANWPSVDGFVSAYAVRSFMEDLPQVSRVAIGRLNVPASIDVTSEIVQHYAAWVTFADGSRAVIDLTPLAANFASRHLPDRMMLDQDEIESIFKDRRAGVDLNQLQPMITVEEGGELYYVLAKVLVSFERYAFSLEIYPVQPADPITPLSIRPGATANIEINRDAFGELQELALDAGPTFFNDEPQLLTRAGAGDELLVSVLDENLPLLWHLITKFESQPPDPTIPTPTPTITPTPIPTATPTPTPTPKKLPLMTS